MALGIKKLVGFTPDGDKIIVAPSSCRDGYSVSKYIYLNALNGEHRVRRLAIYTTHVSGIMSPVYRRTLWDGSLPRIGGGYPKNDPLAPPPEGWENGVLVLEEVKVSPHGTYWGETTQAYAWVKPNPNYPSLDLFARDDRRVNYLLQKKGANGERLSFHDSTLEFVLGSSEDSRYTLSISPEEFHREYARAKTYFAL